MNPLTAHCLRIVSLCEAHLATGDVFDHPLAVHEIRKATKRLRALSHLAASTMGKPEAKARRADLRAASALIAASCDHTVLGEIAEEVLEHEGSSAQFSSWLADNPPARPKDIDTQLAATFRREREAWEALDVPDPTRLTKAIAKSQKTEAKRRASAFTSDDPEHWHDWRKSVKRLAYQLELDHDDTSPELLPWKELGSQLGRINDLANLATAMESAGIDSSFIDVIDRLGAAAQKNCRDI